jgi:hypothetical protein
MGTIVIVIGRRRRPAVGSIDGVRGEETTEEVVLDVGREVVELALEFVEVSQDVAGQLGDVRCVIVFTGSWRSRLGWRLLVLSSGRVSKTNLKLKTFILLIISVHSINSRAVGGRIIIYLFFYHRRSSFLSTIYFVKKIK